VCRRCCDIDVHKDLVTACVLVNEPGKQREVRKKECRTYCSDLQKLKLWLYASKLESSAPSGKPIERSKITKPRIAIRKRQARWVGCGGRDAGIVLLMCTLENCNITLYSKVPIGKPRQISRWLCAIGISAANCSVKAK
jgi:hypothetical protein